MAVLLMAQVAGNAVGFDVRGESSVITIELPDAELSQLTPSHVETRPRNQEADYDPAADVEAGYE
jgi:hypothetical protein